MFPTTIWTEIGQAGALDDRALGEFARKYQPAVLAFIRRRGFLGPESDDLCQDVFVRVMKGGVLAKADRSRGRFRSLLLAVTSHVIKDYLRKRRDQPMEYIEVEEHDDDFDHEWVVNLTDRALSRLREQGSPYFEVLHGHLNGQPQNRNKLWIARKKLAALIRQEVAYSCISREAFEEEMAYLSRFFSSSQEKE